MQFSGDIQRFGDITVRERRINDKDQKMGVLWEF